MPNNQTSQNPNQNESQVQRTDALLELSLEDLFDQPVSLRGLNLRENFDSDPQDFSFLINLDLEDLFDIPFSTQREELVQEPTDDESEERTSRNNQTNNLSVIHVDYTTNHVFLRAPEPEINSNDDDSIDNTNHEPLLPPVIDIPEPEPEASNPSINIKESELFVIESASASNNIYELLGINVESGSVFEVNGIQNNEDGDLNSANDIITVVTNNGTFEINTTSGEFLYTLSDATDVPDANLFVTDPITIKIDMNESDSIQTHTIDVIIELNQAPVAEDDSYQILNSAVLEVNDVAQGLLGNDTDPNDDDSFTDIKQVINIDGQPLMFPYNLPEGGQITALNVNGTFTFDPLNDFLELEAGDSQLVTFEYTMEDGEGLTSTATVTIEVMGPPPPAPILANLIIPQKSTGTGPSQSHTLMPGDIFTSQTHSSLVENIQHHLPNFAMDFDASSLFHGSF